jgi:CheY-like chemotaxis protein
MTSSAKKKILLAEDDASMRRFIEVILRQAGYEVVAAEDGLSALETAFAEDFAAVVADAIMPQMSGYELCRMLRAGAAETRLPCVILSGLVENDADASLADVFLVKDTNLKKELIDALRKLI